MDVAVVVLCASDGAQATTYLLPLRWVRYCSTGGGGGANSSLFD